MAAMPVSRNHHGGIVGHAPAAENRDLFDPSHGALPQRARGRKRIKGRPNDAEARWTDLRLLFWRTRKELSEPTGQQLERRASLERGLLHDGKRREQLQRR
jgi:hypothetical protein